MFVLYATVAWLYVLVSWESVGLQVNYLCCSVRNMSVAVYVKLLKWILEKYFDLCENL